MTKRFYSQGEQISGTNYFYTFDHLGSVREMTDSSGTIQARYGYDPYGQRTKLSGTMDADFGYTGYYANTQYGDLEFAPFRIYDASLGRFISHDPIGENGGINLYGYVGNNPVNSIDPLGLVVIFTFTDNRSVSVDSAIGIFQVVRNAKAATIRDITITGAHADDSIQYLTYFYDQGDSISVGADGRPMLYGNMGDGEDPIWIDIGSLMAGKFSPDATFHYKGCDSANPNVANNIAAATSAVLHNVEVSGEMTRSHGLPDSNFIYLSPSASYINGAPSIIPQEIILSGALPPARR